jgi:hypothetical protein
MASLSCSTLVSCSHLSYVTGGKRLPRRNTEKAKNLFQPFAGRKKDSQAQLDHVSIAPIRSATSAPSVAESVMDDPGGIQRRRSRAFQLSAFTRLILVKDPALVD